MYRGSTPKFTFPVRFPINKLADFKLSFEQGDKVKLVKSMEDCDIYTEFDTKHKKSRNVISVRLTDKETFLFEPARQLHIQLRAMMTDGVQLVTRELTTYVYDSMYKEELTPAIDIRNGILSVSISPELEITGSHSFIYKEGRENTFNLEINTSGVVDEQTYTITVTPSPTWYAYNYQTNEFGEMGKPITCTTTAQEGILYLPFGACDNNNWNDVTKSVKCVLDENYYDETIVYGYYFGGEREEIITYTGISELDSETVRLELPIPLNAGDMIEVVGTVGTSSHDSYHKLTSSVQEVYLWNNYTMSSESSNRLVINNRYVTLYSGSITDYDLSLYKILNYGFYKDQEHTQLITGRKYKIYIDLATNIKFKYNGSFYIPIK